MNKDTTLYPNFTAVRDFSIGQTGAWKMSPNAGPAARQQSSHHIFGDFCPGQKFPNTPRAAFPEFVNFVVMTDSAQITAILNSSPSVELLRLRNREAILVFLINTFANRQGAVGAEQMHSQLADYLEFRQIERDEDGALEVFDTYEIKAKKYIQHWTDRGFLTNYQDERGDVYYELSSYASKTIDWLSSLKKEEYVGTESKFKNIFSLLKELVEFSNDDVETRIRLLEEKRDEIDRQLAQLRSGEDVKVFEAFEIVPRFKQLNQSAKELLSDFKEVEDNFKEITRTIYQKHAEGSLSKSDILAFAFDALDEIKDSQQGKSFYAFWSFLLNPGLQDEWEKLTHELYSMLAHKGIPVQDLFLKSMKMQLHKAGQRVYKANDKMADKLSRIIRESEASKAAATKQIIQDIKKSLLALSKQGRIPELTMELELGVEISIPFERKLTLELSEEQTYQARPRLAEEDLSQAGQLNRLFAHAAIDKELLRKRIRALLREQSQLTLKDVIDQAGGLQRGLPELFGYMSIVREFRHTVSAERSQRIVFNKALNKSILIPEIIFTT